MNDLREALADLCHRQWSGWMEYLFSRTDGMDATTGEVVIPAELVERWKRQMQTPYAALSEAEKDSDRKEADKFIEIIKPIIERAEFPAQELDRLQGLVRDCRRKDETGQACLERMLTNGRMVLIAETRERGLRTATNDAERRVSEAETAHANQVHSLNGQINRIYNERERAIEERDEYKVRAEKAEARLETDGLIGDLKRAMLERDEARQQTVLLKKMLTHKNPEAINNLAKALGSPEAEETRHWAERAETAEAKLDAAMARLRKYENDA